MMDPREQFRDALARRNIIAPANIVADGAIHRCDAEGRNGKGDAAYLLHLDGIAAGGFENWRDGLGWETWRANIGRRLSPIEAAELSRHAADAKAKREAEEVQRYAEARERAAAKWEAAKPADPTHPYLVTKAVKPHGIRQEGDHLVIPLRDASGELHSLQFIPPNGKEKRFLFGGRVRGCYFGIGKPDGVLCIAEGCATGASIFEATGRAVAVAFNVGNLEAVAVALRAKYPDARIVICGDDDYRTADNPGIAAATKAARAVGGLIAVPDFGDDRPEGATDMNDLAQHRGREAVERAVAHATPAGVSADQATAPNASAGRGWGKPQPIRASLSPVPRFDADTLLPDPLRAWIVDEAERMPCAPDFLAAAALVGLGAVIGARCAIKPKARDAWLIVPNLWGGAVALPSAKKSPSMDAALRPVDRLAAKASEAHRAELEAFETDATIHKARGEAIEDAIKTAAKKADATIEAHADALRRHKASAPKPPTMRRYQTNDTTVAKLGELLRDSTAGLLIRRDELVGLLASWDHEGNEGDRAFYLEAWNGTGSYYTDRIGRGHISIPNLCVSIFGGIQPDKLTAYLEQAAHALGNDGMLQRLQMLVYPDPRPWGWRDRSPDRQARDTAFRLFDVLADFDPVQWGATPAEDGQRFPYFRFDDGAQAVFIEWMHDLQRERIPREQADGHPLIAQHLAKYDKLFPSLALILHLAECTATGQRGPVTEAAALRAAAWCEYLEGHARRCYGLLLDGGQRGAAMLARRIEGGALTDGFTAREVRRKGWRHLTTDAEVNAALDWLEDEDWLQAVQMPPKAPGGRPTVRYVINPEIQQRGGCPTDKTDETPVSAVLAVPHPADSEELQGAANG